MVDASDERTLANRLAGLSSDALSDLLRVRSVSPTVGWRDFFDAAEALLDAASVDRVLIRMPRPRLDALTAAIDAGVPAAADERDTLVAEGLAREDGTPFRVVATRLAALRALHDEAFAAPAADAPSAMTDPRGEAAAAERAFSSVGALADLLLATLHRPLALTAAGSVSAVDRKRLVESGAVDTPEQLDDLLSAASAADLAHTEGREWLVSDLGSQWLALSTADRWERIAAGFVGALPAPLRTPEGGCIPYAAWTGAFPLDPDWPERSARLERFTIAWGLRTPTGDETPWGSAVRTRGVVDSSSLVAHLPPEIDRIYLQADLSAIAPGPLAPHLDLRLRGIAVRESRAQASTYRFTAESLEGGMTEGETAESIRAFLTELSLTGIPQPLAYLIESTAARHGLVRVRTDDVRTRVESADAGLLAAIEVDQALRPLGLLREDGHLTSRVARDAVYWSLVDARYPVVAVDTDGALQSLHRHRLARSTDAAGGGDPYAALIARLQTARGDDVEADWRERELDQAVRARSVVAVVVRLPDGSSREFVLEATGLGGGRLRGRDRAADIERTLPVSSIESVRPV
ncbi:helicase-associated domain-containing protein [Microbacterium sp. RU33B]|uniref:helicase-associated domain-containing protein n=1 Tax=Microbacterium sp. RU33B TaxID=1907390 RepID=UPI0009649654|nr:helicase-associated domain-containing protein [Microbacterium sp. RU33B]SIT70099.1 Helicase conserved C-terminal domain-containing protein [Microbacterium sp. RU33B]